MKHTVAFWLAVATLVPSLLAAQVSNYTFLQNTGTYTEITGGLVLGTDANDDQRFVDPFNLAGGTQTTGPGFDIGFNFYFNGWLFDRIAVNSNGWISLGNSDYSPAVDISSTSSYVPLSSTAPTDKPFMRHRIAAFGRDLQGQPGATLRIQTIGVAPYRICVVQWKNYKRFGTVGTGDNINFQIRLHEAGGLESAQTVEIVYGNVVFGNSAVSSSVAQVGLGGIDANDFACRQTTFPHDWNNTTDGVTNTSGCMLPYSGFSVIPPALGLTFQYEPPPPCTGYPTPGATLASDSNVCPGTMVTCWLQNFIGTDVTYNWAFSVDGYDYYYLYGENNPILNVTVEQTIWFLCEVICNSSGQIAYSDPVQIVVQGVLSLPVWESFETITTNNELPGCMQATNLGSFTLTYTMAQPTYNRYPYSGDKFASFRYGCNDYFFSSAIPMQAGTTYQISLQYITDGYTGWNQLAIYAGTAPSGAAMTTMVTSVQNPVNIQYQELKGLFTPTTTDNYYIGIYCNATFAPWYLTFDDISIIELLPCSGQPAAGTTQSNYTTICPGNAFTLSLSGSSLATGITYQWQISPDGVSWTNIAGATNSTHTTTQTSSAYYRCWVTCVNSGQSAFSSPLFVQTLTTLTLPYEEGFESIVVANEYPNCMSSTNLNVRTFTYTFNQGSYNRYAHTGDKFASFKYGCDDWFFTTAIQAVAGNTYLASLYYITDGYSGWNKLAIYYGTSPTPAAMTHLVTEVLNPINTTYQQMTATFVSAITGTIYIGVYCNASFVPWYLSFDDLLIAEYPPCSGTPVAGNAVTSSANVCSGVPFTLDLTGSTLASSLSYQWQSSPDASVWSAIPGATTKKYQASQVVPTHYRCIVTCLNSGASAVSASVFVGQLGAPSLPYIESFETITANNQFPNCISATKPGTANLTYTQFQTTHNRVPRTGDKFASFAAPCDDYFFTSGVSLESAKNYLFLVYYVTDGYPKWNNISCYYGTSPTVSGMTNLLATHPSPLALSYTPIGAVFTPPADEVYYFGIHSKSQGSAPPFYLTFDDIIIKEFTCDAVSNLTVSSLTTMSAKVTWTCSDCIFPIKMEYGKAPTFPGSANNIIIYPATAPVTLLGLQSNTTYTVFIQQLCDPWGQSPIQQIDFTTLLATGLAEEELPTLMLFPNPSDGQFQLIVENIPAAWEPYATLTITNRIGQTVLRQQLPIAQGQIQSHVLLDVEPGLYLLQLQVGSAQYVSRLMIY